MGAYRLESYDAASGRWLPVPGGEGDDVRDLVERMDLVASRHARVVRVADGEVVASRKAAERDLS